MLLAVDDVGAHGEEETGVHQHPLDPILDLLDVQSRLPFQPGQHGVEQRFGFNLGVLAGGLAGGDQRLADLVRIEGDHTAVALVQAVAPY